MIVLASAKTMKESDVANSSVPIFAAKSEKIRKKIGQMSKTELGTYFKIKGKTLDTTYKYYTEACRGKVITSLDGAVFKQITAYNDEYINENIFVLDAMYGILNGNDQINLFRLDFNLKSVVGTSYYNYWKEDVQNFIISTAHDQLLVLSSDEYTKLLNLQELVKEVFTLNFDNAIKSSVHKKQCRGKIANYCIVSKITNYNALDGLIIEEYALNIDRDNKINISRVEDIK